MNRRKFFTARMEMRSESQGNQFNKKVMALPREALQCFTLEFGK